MAVPKQRHNRGRTRRRRGGHRAYKTTSLVECSNCKKPIISHTVCKYCGSYKSKEYIDVTRSVKDTSKKKKK
ncbi:MAG: 50S ribosomal protein L32 [Patescibacteria group bacterium]|nr:50S ribosomal protein L32 [Patescibacteria group bacterium]